MLNKFLLISLLMIGSSAHAELSLYDQEVPYQPLKKEHALFYATVWGVISAGFAYGIYELGKTLEEPVTTDAFMNDVICLIMMGICAKVAQHSVNEAIDGLDLYFENDVEQKANSYRDC